ncbi:MAG: hypothetical protein GOV15_02520 [Candidatus Diapherotrites archaeon]|nr:hypothetical protein [Candidatus Diapherotrites archaeon]
MKKDVERQQRRPPSWQYPPSSKGVKTVEERDEQLINALENHPDQDLIRNQGFEWAHVYSKKLDGKENPMRNGPHAITLHQSDTSSALTSLTHRGILEREGSHKTKKQILLQRTEVIKCP